MGFNKRDKALSNVSKNSENPNPDFTDAATVNVFLFCKNFGAQCEKRNKRKSVNKVIDISTINLK